MKLSFAYDIPYQFPENTNIIGGEKALHDTPISLLEYEIQQLKTTTNQKFARQLYCGKIWAHNGLCFTKKYYGIDN